jgi:hypothetical protein
MKMRVPELEIANDTAFLELIRMVVPVGKGLIGFILAGLTIATFSSIDSMLNGSFNFQSHYCRILLISIPPCRNFRLLMPFEAGFCIFYQLPL